MGWGGEYVEMDMTNFIHSFVIRFYPLSTGTTQRLNLIVICKKLLELHKIGPHQLLSNIHELKFTVMCMSYSCNAWDLIACLSKFLLTD